MAFTEGNNNTMDVINPIQDTLKVITPLQKDNNTTTVLPLDISKFDTLQSNEVKEEVVKGLADLKASIAQNGTQVTPDNPIVFTKDTVATNVRKKSSPKSLIGKDRKDRLIVAPDLPPVSAKLSSQEPQKKLSGIIEPKNEPVSKILEPSNSPNIQNSATEDLWNAKMLFHNATKAYEKALEKDNDRRNRLNEELSALTIKQIAAQNRVTDLEGTPGNIIHKKNLFGIVVTTESPLLTQARKDLLAASENATKKYNENLKLTDKSIPEVEVAREALKKADEFLQNKLYLHSHPVGVSKNLSRTEFTLNVLKNLAAQLKQKIGMF